MTEGRETGAWFTVLTGVQSPGRHLRGQTGLATSRHRLLLLLLELHGHHLLAAHHLGHLGLGGGAGDWRWNARAGHRQGSMAGCHHAHATRTRASGRRGYFPKSRRGLLTRKTYKYLFSLQLGINLQFELY